MSQKTLIAVALLGAVLIIVAIVWRLQSTVTPTSDVTPQTSSETVATTSVDGVATTTTGYAPTPGDIIRTPTNPQLYYIDTDRKRHLYSSEATFWSWYSGTWDNIQSGSTTKTIIVVPQDQFDRLAVGINVTVRPGSGIVKFSNSERMYEVTGPAELESIDAARAAKLFGARWREKVINLPYTLESDYIKLKE